MEKTRTYSELIKIPTFKGRYKYLQLGGKVGEDTFGYDRWMNQAFYRSKEWKRIRNEVIIRDNGCDLAIKDLHINGPIYIHHMNPLTEDDIEHSTDNLLNPEYLICVSFDTHQAIHFGDESLLPVEKFIERTPGDTNLW